MTHETKPVRRPTAGRLLDDSLFVDDGGVLALAGSRCRACATVTFPAQGSCPRCAGTGVERTALPTSGAVWGYTVQRFPPKTPYLGADRPGFEPYAVGYVNVGDEVLVESRLVGDVDAISVGDEATLVLEAIAEDDTGPILTYAFAVRREGANS